MATMRKILLAVMAMGMVTLSDACGQDFEVESGSIQSPNFPRDYPNDLLCEWRIFNVDPGHPIVVTFAHLDVEPTRGCHFDAVSVFSGEVSDQNLIGKYCGPDLPGPIISEVSPLIIQLRTDEDFGGTFNLTFSAEKIPSGDNQNDGTEETDDNQNDETEETDDNQNDESEETDDNQNDETEETDDNQNDESEETDDNRNDESDACGQDFEVESGSIQSPNFPRDYPNDLLCEWRIFNVDPGHPIVVTFVHLDVEPTIGCRFDAVSVFSGEVSDQNRIGKYCGPDLPGPIISEVSPVIIQLRTDEGFGGTGFNLTFLAEKIPSGDNQNDETEETDDNQNNETDACGQDFEVESGSIQSPNFPRDYPNDLLCEWRIFNVDPGHPIVVTFAHLDVEPTIGCRFDAVSVFSGEVSDQNRIGKYCGPDLPGPIISEVSPVIIQLRTDEGFGGTGFNLTFLAEKIPSGDNQNDETEETDDNQNDESEETDDNQNDETEETDDNQNDETEETDDNQNDETEETDDNQNDETEETDDNQNDETEETDDNQNDETEETDDNQNDETEETDDNQNDETEETDDNQNDETEEIPPDDNQNDRTAGQCNCSVHGDPHVKINQGKPYLLPIPCAHKVAHLQTSPEDGSCDLQINGLAEFAHPDDLRGACYETLIHIRLELGFGKVFTFIFSEKQNLTFSHTGNLEQDDVTIDPCGPEFCKVNIEKCGMTFTYEASKHSFKMSVPMGIVDNEGICGTCDGKVGGSGNPSREMILNNTLDSLYPFSPIDNSSINTDPICNSLYEVLQMCDAPYAREMCAPLAIDMDVRRCVRPQLDAPKTLLGNYYECLETECVDGDKGNCHSTYDAFFLGCADEHLNRNCD